VLQEGDSPTPATVSDLFGTWAQARAHASRCPPRARAQGSHDAFDELAVANESFFIDKFGAECSDLQGLRELTINGMKAIASHGADATGRVVWDVDW
jgi:hypothetical protein